MEGQWVRRKSLLGGLFVLLGDRQSHKQSFPSSSQSARGLLMTGVTWQLTKQSGLIVVEREK